jgi:phage terminase large subunit-like protein
MAGPANVLQHPHVFAAEAYARDVVKGKIPNCQWVKAACKRHLDDLKRAKKDKAWGYHFSPDAAEKVCRFVELMPLTKGKWAAKRENFVLQPWQCFKTVVLFGWLRNDNNKRRFRRAFLLIPRKNGKSEWAGAIGNYMHLADGEFGAEVYSGATTEKQAWFVFGAARQMALRSPRLVRAFGLSIFAKNMHIDGRNSRFEPIIGDPGDGGSPHCAIVDEYHEHITDNLVETMQTGMGAREQPLLLIITTAGANIAGPCYQAQLEAQKVLSGVMVDEELFAIIYGIDKGDDWKAEESLRKANPNADVSVDLGWLKSQIAIAAREPRKAGKIKTKHLNIWVTAREAYFSIEKWMASAEEDLRLEDFLGQRCVIGLDLASKIDVASLVMVFRREPTADGKDRFAVFATHYLPEDTVEGDGNDHYKGWSQTMGHNGGPIWTDEEMESWDLPEEAPRLRVTDGEMIDYAVIEEDLLAMSKAFQIDWVAYDPFQATYLVTRLQAAGVPCLEYRQVVLNFSEPMKEVEAYMRGRRIAHDGDPVLAWMISNVTAKEDAKENVYPRKEQPQNKIDGAVAMIAAFGAMKVTPEDTESVYTQRGVVEFEIEEI